MRSLHFATGMALAAALLSASHARAQPPVPAFYAAVGAMKPAGKLGQVIARERVATSLPGAIAWRIAYISSDMADNKTISTGLVIIPKGKPPKGGRPVMSWAHGTTGTAQSCGPSQVVDPAAALNEYFLPNGNSWTDYGVPAVTGVRQLMIWDADKLNAVEPATGTVDAVLATQASESFIALDICCYHCSRKTSGNFHRTLRSHRHNFCIASCPSGLRKSRPIPCQFLVVFS